MDNSLVMHSPKAVRKANGLVLRHPGYSPRVCGEDVLAELLLTIVSM